MTKLMPKAVISMDKKKIKQAIKNILEAVGEDITRDGIKGTPERVANMLEEIFCGIKRDPAKELGAIFPEDHHEMVLVKDMPFFSICEHHLLPFFGKAHVAYIPQKKRISGLSKFARLVDVLSRRLQLQERLTTKIVDTINKMLKPKGVMVIVEAEHMCMTMRGVNKPGVKTITSAVRGTFKTNMATRQEVMALIRKK
jgi:GTP cyclohydrolase I